MARLGLLHHIDGKRDDGRVCMPYGGVVHACMDTTWRKRKEGEEDADKQVPEAVREKGRGCGLGRPARGPQAREGGGRVGLGPEERGGHGPAGE